MIQIPLRSGWLNCGFWMDAGLHDHVQASFIVYNCCDSAVVLWSRMPKVYCSLTDSEMVWVDEAAMRGGKRNFKDYQIFYCS